MSYAIRPATIGDIPHIVGHREQMFRDMGIAAEFGTMAAVTRTWLAGAIPDGTYRGWVVHRAGTPQAGAGAAPDGGDARLVSRRRHRAGRAQCRTFGQSVYAGMGYVVANEPMMRLKL